MTNHLHLVSPHEEVEQPEPMKLAALDVLCYCSKGHSWRVRMAECAYDARCPECGERVR